MNINVRSSNRKSNFPGRIFASFFFLISILFISCKQRGPCIFVGSVKTIMDPGKDICIYFEPMLIGRVWELIS